jgi:valyl-tRNA synthetase
MSEMNQTYDHKRYEPEWYQFWLDEDLFSSEPDSAKEPFVILMPPPNVTSQLHMGHGTGYSFQDLLIRWKRMSGYDACWLPGTDHAGIATQMMVERSLQESGETRQELGRENFFERCEQWRTKYGEIILEQFRKLGFSCDWDRVAYTMDQHLSMAVRHVFVELFEQGLIYRGERLVNWDCHLQTAVSDDEVESIETQGHLWFYRYKVQGSDRHIPIATTRPETMLGDSAVAVNPEDDRFKDLIGKKVELPFVNRVVPIIGDDYVKSEFGTGAVKITPAHDHNDFEIGKRHKLAMINVMDIDGSMNASCPDEFRGKDRFEARRMIIDGLKELGLFDKVDNYKNTLPHSERSKTVIEPRLSQQWFVSMKELAAPAADAARTGEVNFYPDAWKKTYLYWLDNVQDWCISRQLWWGHRIPVWHCADCQGHTTGMETPKSCSHCSSENISQDKDVLDTWFSSWLWPMSPFGWPDPASEKTLGFHKYYPSNVLVTATEIIFLWVARMIMAGLKFKGEVPFKDVYFNATVCDKKGRKFSKTLGNGIDPLEVIETHGADAVRYTAVSLAPLGGRIKMSPSDFETGARFSNKIWNAARFMLRSIDSGAALPSLKTCELSHHQKWIVNRVHVAAESVDKKFSSYRLNDAVQDIYHLAWSSFCDWEIECSKSVLSNSEHPDFKATASTLVYCFDQILRLLHPVMPFITEELWQKLPHHPDLDRPKSISIAHYPTPRSVPSFSTEATQWEKLMGTITVLRNLRAQGQYSPKEKSDATLQLHQQDLAVFEANMQIIEQLSGCQNLVINCKTEKVPQALVGVFENVRAFVTVDERIDLAKERSKLEADLTKTTGVVAGMQKKLGNENFVRNAPQEVIAETKQKIVDMSSKIESLKMSIQWLN